MHRTVWLAALAGLLAVADPALAQGVGSFGVDVLERTPPRLPLSALKVTVTLSSDEPVAFRVTNPHGVERRFPASGSVSPGSEADTASFCGTPCFPPEAVAADFATLDPPLAGLSVGDPARRRYVFNIDTNSDYDPNASCASTMTGPETWTIALDAPSATQRIVGTCVESFDLDLDGHRCRLLRRTPLDGEVAHVSGAGQPQAFCGDERPAVHATLVLDRSGSMGWATPTPRILALRSAVTDLVASWTALGPEPGDHLGIVFFDHNARWHNNLGVLAWNAFEPGPQSFASFAPTVTTANLDNIIPMGATTIGGGLLEAATHVAEGDQRRVVLLMTDGMQNRNPLVRVDDPVNPTRVLTHPRDNPSDTTELPEQNTFQIYSVTVGPSTTVAAAINQDVARATGGFYINTEDDPNLLRPFFQELLQNFLRFNTYEVVRLAPATLTSAQPHETRFGVSSTTDRLFANVTTAAPGAVLRVSLIPPNGMNPILRADTGRVQITADLRRSPAPGEWRMQVELVSGIRGQASPVPIEVVVLADDPLLNSDLAVVQRDYAPGDDIVVRARLTQAGRPLTALGPGGRVVARVARPGVSVGEILSAAGAPPTQVRDTGDVTTHADAQLATLLEANPDALARLTDEIVLRDDGTGGDEVAGDGIYSAVFRAQEPGHYHFVISAQGTTERHGPFTREQVRTVYVRAVPATAQTTITTTVEQAREGSALQLRMVPRTSTGSRLGPGWANYIWFTAAGRTVRAVDQGDGSYTTSVPFTGAAPPRVEVHFIRTSTLITDEVQPENLPVRLGQGTRFIPDAQMHGREPPDPRRGICASLPFSSSLLGGLLLLGLLMGRRRER
jgi:hypothetical protein